LVHAFWNDVCSVCEERCLQNIKNEIFIKIIPKYSLVLCIGMKMGKEKLQQTLFPNLFKTITIIEREDVL
jgi:hypothetical protein